MASYFVKIPGEGTCLFELPSEGSRVKDLVGVVLARSNDSTSSIDVDPAESQAMQLYWGGKYLGLNSNSQVYNAPLSSLGINPGSTLEVHIPLRGGAQCGKMVKGRSKEKPQNDELAAKLKWLQEQAAGRIAAHDALKAQKEKAAEESAMMKKNNMKIMTAMRSLMRNEKLGELRNMLEVLASLHEAAVKRKDELIARLIENHEFAFEQHTAASMAHTEHLERLMKLQDQRLLLIERQFEADLKVLADEYDDERDEIIAKHKEEMLELEAIDKMIQEEEKQEEDANIAELVGLKMSCRNSREDKIDDLRSVLDGRLELIQDAFENAHLEYLERTDKRVSDFKHYTRINRDREKDIERSVRSIERLQLQMQEIRNNMQLSGRKFEDQRSLLTAEKASIQQQVVELRDTMRKFQAGQRSRRAGLALSADKAKKTLESHIQLAERILGLGEMARKKETEREKVLPFLVLSKETDMMELEVGQAGEVEPANIADQKHPLANFHKKFNRALAEKLVVENERDRLRRENDHLMTTLKEVQDGLVVNDEVLKKNNPLFVINGRSNAQSSAQLPVVRQQNGGNSMSMSSSMARQTRQPQAQAR